MSETEPDFAAAMRKVRRRLWEQASGRDGGESPPMQSSGNETGLGDDPRVAALQGKVNDIDSRVSDLEDDFPEPELMNSGEGQSGGRWSGIVWWMGAIKYDFSKGGASPSGDPAAGGLSGEIGGIFLIIDLRDGSYSWSDSAPDSEETAAYKNYYPVGSSDGGTPPEYSLSVGRVVGDIRIDYVPYHAPLEEAAEES